jgi:hypothetical protein
MTGSSSTDRAGPDPAEGAADRDETGLVEQRASSAAAEKLRQSIERLRALRSFEDEPADFIAWIEQHARD